MGCNCKKDKNNNTQNNEETNLITKIFKTLFNILIFSFSMLLSPLALVGFVIIMFRVIILSKDVDVVTSITDFISNYRKYKEVKEVDNDYYDDDDDDYELTSDNYEMVNVDVITKDTK